MTQKITFTIDDVEVTGKRGQTIMQVAMDHGIYIPHLCFLKDLTPGGRCRVCTVLVNGRPQSACTHPIGPNMIVENDTEELRKWRKSIIDMLFVEGNHFCMFCERSGNCELQALAYRFGITSPQHPFLFPKRDVDATHPEVLLDRNRCVLCGRCERASKEVDGKNVFGFVGRGHHMKIGVNAPDSLSETGLKATDKAAEACPVGSILVKHKGYAVPVGRRLYDEQPIGTEIEAKGAAKTAKK